MYCEERMTIAISDPARPKEVSLWVSAEKKRKDGSFDFDVINGLWKGTFYSNNTIKVHLTGMVWPAIVVWEGTVPAPDSHNYNTAIEWIEREINNE